MSRDGSRTPIAREDLVAHLEAFAAERGDLAVAKAIDEALADTRRDRFRELYDVDREAEESCIGRLITGEACPHGAETSATMGTIPHHPPAADDDRAALWLRDCEPAAFSVHVADLEGDRLRSVVVYAERHGLEVRINPASWRGPRAICVVFFAPEWVPREVE